MLTIAMPILLQKIEAEKINDGKYFVNRKAPGEYVSVPLSDNTHTHTHRQ